MAAGVHDLTIEQGATFEVDILWKDSDEVLIDLTGYSARMQIRSKDGFDTKLYELTTENGGITITNENEIQLRISAVETAKLALSKARYDLEVELAGIVTRLIQGNITISQEVTK